MTDTVTMTAHIWLDDKGVPWVDNTNTKVIEIVLDRTALGMSPEEIHYQHPHLSLSQIHAALSYYYDHKSELDADIERRDRMVEEMRKAAKPSPLVERLRAAGKLS